jgi:hypothetical protein
LYVIAQIRALLDDIKVEVARQRNELDDDLRKHSLWLVKTMMTNLTPEDLSTGTLVKIAEALAPDHSAFVARRKPRDTRPTGKVLKLIPGPGGNPGA